MKTANLEEDHLRQELVPNTDFVTEEDVVETAEDDTKGHVDDSENDGHLHLVRIQENQHVVRAVPSLNKKMS